MLLLLACTQSPDDTGVVAVYDDLDKWLCHADKPDDVCSRDLDTTVVEADGSTSVVEHVPAVEPAFDCFYVYPTCSLDQEGNSDWEPGIEEEFLALNQAARFSEVCRVFAPVYRQRTVLALFSDEAEGDLDLAFEDVREAWGHYLANDNEGRGVVLVGHSQGSLMLKRLLAEEIEPDAAQTERIIGAYPIGYAIRPGELQTPMCASEDEAGCVVSYLSYRADDPPDDGVIFAELGEAVECVNPAFGEGPVPLGTVLPTEIPAELAAFVPGGTNPWQEEGPLIDTPFFSVPGLVHGECTDIGDFSYLAVTTEGDPDTPRADDIEGDFLPGWGLHLVDVHLTMTDLVDLAERQHAAW